MSSNAPARVPRHSPRSRVGLVCSSMRNFLAGVRLKQQCSFLIRLSSQAQLYSLEMVKVEGFTEGEFWYWTDDAESKSQPALHVRVIRVAAKKRHNDVWLVTNVLNPKRLPAGLAARFYRMRWESECFFRTYKRVV